jgi:hypothetical protein
MEVVERKLIVSVFGNEVEEKDNLVVRLVPQLKKLLPQLDFHIADPTENIKPPSDPWIILDVGMGIDEVVVIEDLKQLDYVKGQSVHDYDVYMDLRLREKVGQLPKMKIILVPYEWEEERAIKEVARHLDQMVKVNPLSPTK